MKTLILKLLLLTSLMANWAWAEIAVVVHPSNATASLSAEEAANIFLGKSNTYPGGAQAIPVDLAEGDAIRNEFYQKIASKSPAQMNAYWSNLIFTGKGQPPKAVADAGLVLELVSENPNMIGYVDASEVDDTVKVVLTVQ